MLPPSNTIPLLISSSFFSPSPSPSSPAIVGFGIGGSNFPCFGLFHCPQRFLAFAWALSSSHRCYNCPFLSFSLLFYVSLISLLVECLIPIINISFILLCPHVFRSNRSSLEYSSVLLNLLLPSFTFHFLCHISHNK